MKFATFKIRDSLSWGLVADDSVFDLGSRGAGASLLDYVSSGAAEVWPSGRADYPLSEVELSVPLGSSRIFCIGFNYHAHRDEMGQETVKTPLIFMRSTQSIVAHGAALWRPAVSDNFDFEGELACIIGAGGRHISESESLNHVFGYSIFNDGSIRDFQESSITAGKNFDSSGAFGPWIVDRREAPNWDAMHIRTKLNGQTVQDSGTDLMVFGVPKLIAYISSITRLVPGDVIATGTPSGVGWRRDPRLWMKPGDTVDVEIDGIGHLSNPVIAEPR